MSHYQDLIKQANELMAQAEQIRRTDRAAAIAEIKSMMTKYKLSPADLGGSVKPSKTKSKSDPKYRGPNGELWGGGPGRKPDWVKAAMASGQGIDQYRI